MSDDSKEVSIERVESGLRRLGDQHEPPAGWDARVMAQYQAERRVKLWSLVGTVAAFIIFASLLAIAVIAIVEGT